MTDTLKPRDGKDVEEAVRWNSLVKMKPANYPVHKLRGGV